ncbi:MAG: peptidase, partial [Rikenellaceae bacterium]|nr:peptidase [Rikenellaceae bacterium]
MKRLKILLICIIAASGVAWVTNPDENPDAKITKNLEILFNLFMEINLFYVDPVNPDSLLRSAAWGMSRHLDPYTEYFSKKD